MPNFASITIIGHIGKDMELATLPNGTEIGKFNIAVSTGWKDKKTTTWYRCAIFGKQAPSLQPYLLKGRPVLVQGEPSLREWTNNEGRKVSSLEVRVTEVKLLGDSGNHGHSAQSDQPASHAQDPEEAHNAPAQPPTADSGEIPF